MLRISIITKLCLFILLYLVFREQRRSVHSLISRVTKPLARNRTAEKTARIQKWHLLASLFYDFLNAINTARAAIVHRPVVQGRESDVSAGAKTEHSDVSLLFINHCTVGEVARTCGADGRVTGADCTSRFEFCMRFSFWLIEEL